MRAALVLVVVMLSGCAMQSDFRMTCKGKDVECSLDGTRKAETI